MFSNNHYLPTIVTTVAVVGGTYCAYKAYQYTLNKKLPTEWLEVGTLKKIYAYPIKSCGPVILEEAECTALGLRDSWLRDRVLMVVDSKNNFITARVYPDMLLVSPSVNGATLTLAHNDMKSVSVNLAEIQSSKSFAGTVWGVSVPLYDCGPQVGEWFSNLLGVPGLRLVYYASQSCRNLRAKNNKTLFKFTENDTSALADETSYNLINDASIDDLNSRLIEKVSHRNFRPNFLLEGATPLGEDNWKYIKIGDNIFEIIKPCGRCVLTTIDPETGIKSAKTEPLQTLRSYRTPEKEEVRSALGNAPCMGVQMTLRSASGRVVRLNDAIAVAH